MKLKKVTKTGFTTEDGRVFQHPVELDTLMPLQQFQKIYDRWETIIKESLSGNLCDSDGETVGHHRSK